MDDTGLLKLMAWFALVSFLAVIALTFLSVFIFFFIAKRLSLTRNQKLLIVFISCFVAYADFQREVGLYGIEAYIISFCVFLGFLITGTATIYFKTYWKNKFVVAISLIFLIFFSAAAYSHYLRIYIIGEAIDFNYADESCYYGYESKKQCEKYETENKNKALTLFNNPFVKYYPPITREYVKWQSIPTSYLETIYERTKDTKTKENIALNKNASCKVVLNYPQYEDNIKRCQIKKK